MKPGGKVVLCQRLRVATSDLRAPGAARSICFPGSAPTRSWVGGEVLWSLVGLGVLVWVVRLWWVVGDGGRQNIRDLHSREK